MAPKTITLSAALATVGLVGGLAFPTAALAGEKGRKNTAIGLGAAAAHQLLTGKTRNGLILGAGAAYSYKRYQDARRDEKRKERISEYSSTRRSASTTRSNSRYGGSSANVSRRSRTTTDPYANRASFETNKGRYGSFVFTGPVANDASELVNRRITVDHNGIMRPVQVPSSATILHAGSRASVHDLRRGDVVRVTADKTGENKWNATRVEVLKSVETMPRAGAGSILREDARETTRTRRAEAAARYSGVGIIQSVSEDDQSFVVRAGDNLRTIFTAGSSYDGIGGMHELRVGDRVRVNGDLEGRDVFATEIVLLD